jgi:tetratricopeptide (TPR) repeat protein
MLKLIVSITAICFVWIIKTTAQEPGVAVAFADRQYQSGNYQSAVREYQRAILFCEGSSKPYLQRQAGLCFFSLNDFDRARQFLLEASNAFPDDSMKMECLFTAISCSIQQGKFFTALKELSLIPETNRDFFNRKKFFYSGICYWSTNRYETAFDSFRQCLPGNNQDKILRLQSIETAFQKPANPNPRLAFLLSLLPGAGQIYAGDVKGGISSLLICSALVATGYVSMVTLKSNIFLLYLIPWIQRYYVGGMIYARDLAEQRETDRKNRICLEILSILSDSEN